MAAELTEAMHQQRAKPTTIARESTRVDFDNFFREHCDRAHRLAWRLVGGNDAAAADVVQEAFFKAYRGLRQFRAEAQLTTWFHRIVVNEAASYWRGGWVKRWFGAMPDSDAVMELSSASDIPKDSRVQKRIAAAITKLSRAQREAFVLVHLEEYTMQEAAELMGIGLGSVKQHVHRALVHLRKDLVDLRTESSDER